MQKTFILVTALLMVAMFPLFPDSYRDQWQQPGKVMDVIGVKAGMAIGEAGAGRGYFTFKMAKRVGKTGKIYANDINPSVLKKIKQRMKRENVSNIQTVTGIVDDPLFPEKQLDMVIMVYVLHDLEKPILFLKNIIPYLKPGGTLVILERDPDKWSGARGHFLEQKEVLSQIKAGGFKIQSIETFLKRDNIYICRPK